MLYHSSISSMFPNLGAAGCDSVRGDNLAHRVGVDAPWWSMGNGGPTTRLFRQLVKPKLFRQFFQSAQIVVLTVARQQAHHKLSFGIIFSPQVSTSGLG